MDQLPNLGRGIAEVLMPTFMAYAPLLQARTAEIRSAQRSTHKYGPNERHVLDLYVSSSSSPTSSAGKNVNKTVLVFVHGGGFHSGQRAHPTLGGGEGIVFGNIGRFFTNDGDGDDGNVDVVIPDYRLLSHGARYPSGGEDLAFVVDWVREHYAKVEGGRDVDLVLLGNSAGGVHVATFLLDEAFEEKREKFIVGGKKNDEAGAGRLRLRGVVFVGAPFAWPAGDANEKEEEGKEKEPTIDPGVHVRTYLGEDSFAANLPLGVMQRTTATAATAELLRDLKVLILVSELDPEVLFKAAEVFGEAWKKADWGGNGSNSGNVESEVLKGHNHMSPQLSLSTGIEREEAWGVRVVEFLRTCRGA